MNAKEMDLQLSQKGPLHQQVRQVLEGMATMPEYAGGSQPLPPEVDLAEQFGVSRGTVRKAITQLVHEGLLERRRGSGTRVSGKRVETRLEAWYSFSGEMQSRSLPFDLIDWELGQAAVPRRAAETLGIRTGRQVWTLRRLLGIGGEPTVDFISWFASEIDLSRFDPRKARLYSYLESTCHVQVHRSREAITARTADDEEAATLRVEPGAALLIRRRQVYGRDGTPIEYNEGVYRADRFEYTVELQRK